MSSYMFGKLIRQASGDWKREDVASCSLEELQTLCALLNIAHTGTKSILIERLLNTGALRGILSNVSDPTDLVDAYSAGQLAGFCQTARIPSIGNKYSRAARLLSWRNECRTKGQAYYEECVQQVRTKPNRQRRLFPL